MSPVGLELMGIESLLYFLLSQFIWGVASAEIGTKLLSQHSGAQEQHLSLGEVCWTCVNLVWFPVGRCCLLETSFQKVS